MKTKTWLSIQLLFLFSVLTVSFTYAQKGKSFEGIIVYGFTVDMEGIDAASKSMLESAEIKVSVKGDKTHTETDMGMVKTASISDAKNKSVITLMDIMGQKYSIKISGEELEKEQEKEKDAKIVYLDETKEIAGYKCKKGQYTPSGSTETMYFYYTTEIPYNKYSSQIKGIAGVPLEYEINQSGIKMLVTAKNIKAETVPDSKFVIPAGYTETTAEELQKMFGQ